MKIDQQQKLCRSVLRKFKYKPGWKFKCVRAGQRMLIQLEYRLPNTDRPKQMLTISSRLAVDPRISTELGLLRWLRTEILIVEIHEAEEWIRFGEKRPFDPHKEINRIYRSAGEKPPLTPDDGAKNRR